MHRKSLHLALAALFAAPLAAPYLEAQIHKVAAPETVTRAVGVYEFTGTLEKPSAVRMIPVTIFINNRLEDAGTYLTRPMPLALQTGVIYSIEQAGKPIGTVTLDYARHALPPGVNPELAETGSWNGFGNFAPPEKPKPSTLAAAKKIGPITGGNDNPDDDRPHFTGKQPGDGNTTPAATTTASTTNPANPANPAPADDPDRPHLNKHEPSATPASTTPDPDINDDTDRPTLKHRDLPPEDSDGKPKKPKKQGDSAVIPMSSSLNEDPDRPTLKRGKSTGVATPQELQGIPVDLHQIVAVSDASNRDAHVFARQWETHTEHADVQAKLAALAQPLITKYEADNKIEAPTLTELPVNTRQSSTHATTRAKGKSAAAKTASATTHPLNEESVTGFELTYSGLPTFVYTASSPINVGGPVYVTLVAQRLPTGEYQTSLASITDAAHLDRTPWFRLIDAVDPDASHRASLLFELRAASTREFALYRLITAHAEQQFVTGVIQ